MDEMKNGSREERLRVVMDELGCDRETAEFAVALADGKASGCNRAITVPMPEPEATRQAALLVEFLGFTPDEAARYVSGDRSAIEAVAARRLAADDRAIAPVDSLSRGSALSPS
jgi:hypothetical protein